MMLNPATPLPCNHDRRGRFCCKCGVELNPPPLTFRSLLTEFLAGWLQKGFRQTVVGLTLAPGHQVRLYLRENRSLLIKPVAYLVLITAFNYWVLSLFGTSGDGVDPRSLGIDEGKIADPLLLQAVDWLVRHLYQFALAQAFLMALMLRYIFYRRSGYSLPELTILMIYLLAQSTLLQAVAGLFFLPFQRPMPPNLHFVLGALYLSWAIGQFMPGLSPWKYLRAAFAYLGMIAAVFIVVVGALLAWDQQAALQDAVIPQITHER